MFPHQVPDRYRELMRVARQWWQLKLLKWNGLGHDRRDPKDGDLALFCPACPQPGINVTIPAEPNDTRPGWLYTRSLVMDGNFKAEHLHPVHLDDEVWLTDGRCFMVARERYQAHLALAKDSAQRSECNNHRAVNQANVSRQKLEATGIGGCACARHGCFVPNSMVDFQKGERQMNMDYALCNTLGHNTDGLRQALTFYDINCQYNKHLWRRVDKSLHLTIPKGMAITPGIGLWHIHGHQEKCFVRYASNFIPVAAQIDGEIMETLWANLNIISPSARGMSTPHQQECLDYQMNDCNFMKMICMGLFLSRKYKEAKQGLAESSRAFDALNNAAEPEMVNRWEVQEREAQSLRIDDPSALDIYDVWMQKARSRKEVELNLLQKSFHRPGERPWLGAATWLASGITIEEMQIALAMEIWKMGRHPTETQMLQISHRRLRLQHSIDEFIAGADRYLGEEYNEDDCIPDMDIDFMDDGHGSGWDDSEDDSAPEGHCPQVLFRPELVTVPLPSNLGLDRCEELGIGSLVRQEITLREGQANDMLHTIRVHLADKAILFRTTVQPAKSQVATTRAWLQVHLVERVISLNSTIYKKCRAQLSNLGAVQLLDKYRELVKNDLKATSAVADPNARGQRNSTLPWFWSLDVQGDSVNNDWMNEFMSSTTPPAYVNKSARVVISMWDLAKIFEYATCRFTSIHLALDKSEVSRTVMFRKLFVQHLVWEANRFVFPFINICALINTAPALPEYLNDIVKMLTEWQVLDPQHEYPRRRHGPLLDDAHRISLEEVKDLCLAHMDQMPAGYLLIPDMKRHKGGTDPLLNNLWVIKDDLQQLGTQLDSWLSAKVDKGRGALEAMARMEGPVDGLHDAMAASQRLLGTGGREDEE
ncbi:hypothetical protein DFJ58DRAFT_847572 [Suillus subalutaceus]|uniref:uncharacterized protein n=1 Tax=Suillus subalutaceus TaxID=48586 RepID=UPI001B85FEA0|nr:uncharacterized protein DFJ58DRAFT_847572 [Suillus subalutaceus]KAG1834638.1 hypothetical protein DFJ58DRAFT_847572 [Suillus subalutaceus]